jgi:hypothetical protein
MGRQSAFIERRTVEFSEDGILQVVDASLRAAGSFGLPSMPPDSVRLLPEEGKVAFGYGGSGETVQWVSMEAEQLGALLVAYCIRMKVPLPRKGDKGVLVKAHTVLLTFQVHHAEATAPRVAEPSTIRPAAVRSWSWRSPGTSAYGGVIEDRPPVGEPVGAVGQEPGDAPDRLATLLENAKPWLPAS